MKHSQAAKITAFFMQTPKRVRASDEGEKDEGAVAEELEDVEGESIVDEEDGTNASADEHITHCWRQAADSARHRTGYNQRWESERSWLHFVDGEGMYCNLCQKFDTRNRQNQSKVWNKEPCTTL